MKINLVVENVGGLGVKLTKKEGKLGAKFAWKLMCPKLNPISREVLGDERDFEK